MNTKLTALAVTALAALTFAPKPALAGDKEWAAVGGFVGGLIVGSALNDHHRDSYPDRHDSVRYTDRSDCGDGRDDAGYWKTVTVRVWVPGCWVVERSRHGHGHRRYVDGYYTFRTDRVWVSNEHSGRHGRDSSYGYGRRP